MDIRELLTAARRAAGLRSNRALSLYMGANACTAHSWWIGEKLPSDDALAQLCKIAGAEPRPWLLWLNMQRCTGPAVAIYRDMAEAVLNDLQQKRTEQVPQAA